jgi:subtilase family serine protease
LVGGTTLVYNNGTWQDQEDRFGKGVSLYEAQPPYQSTLPNTVQNVQGPLYYRTIPDVSFYADGNSDDGSPGYSIYDSYGASGWIVGDGTSAACPCWAAIIADADQLRAANGLTPLSSAGGNAST